MTKLYKNVNGVDVELTAQDLSELEAVKQASQTGALDRLRDERNVLLSKSDWIVTKSLESGVVIPQQWVEYRQALRDITNTYASLEEVVWPTKPAE